MKNRPCQEFSPFVSPPGETLRNTSNERRSTEHRNDPAQHWQHQAGEHDNRPAVAASGAPQRIRARQTEARTAEHCHVRTHRRP